MDGTLYDQRPVRLAMALSLAVHVMLTGRWRDVRAISAFRRARERLSEDNPRDFEPELYRRLAATAGLKRAEIEPLVAEWMESRPLRHVRRAKAIGVDRLFRGLRASGRTIGIWSDYPVDGKLRSLELEADHVVWAGDDGIGCLKPDPRGLQILMERAKARPCETLLIGDRHDRDGSAARLAGVPALVRSRRPEPGFATFRRYDDPIFAPVLAQ